MRVHYKTRVWKRVSSDPSPATLTNQLWLAHGRWQVGPQAFNPRTSTGQFVDAREVENSAASFDNEEIDVDQE